MHIGRPSILGLLVLVSMTVSCSADTDEPAPVESDAAVASYAAPDDAPSFCTRLARSTHLTAIPTAVGSLAAGTDAIEARVTLSGAIRELRAVRDDVRAEGGFEALEADLAGLVEALTLAMDGPLTDPVRIAVADGLDGVGELAQPVCRFPA